MSSNGRYTIILPVHNGGQHAKECVESVLSQKLGDFELIVLENASTDGTREWLATIRDRRIRVLPSDTFLPIEANWTRSLGIPKNEFMTFIGHDDCLDPDYLLVMDDLVRRYPDAGLYFAHFRYIDAQGRKLRSCRPLPDRETAAQYMTALFSDQRDTYGTGYVYLSRRYEELGGMPQWDHLLFADDALWISLMGGTWKATAREECFACRVHPDSYGHRAGWRDWAEGMLRYLAFLQAFAAHDPVFSMALAECAPGYFLKWCNALYLRALREACQHNRRLDPNELESLIRVIRVIAPSRLGDTRWSMPFGWCELINRFTVTRWMYFRYRQARPGVLKSLPNSWRRLLEKL
jgi:glycosyltransferase involved in cell wall biosynthesis